MRMVIARAIISFNNRIYITDYDDDDKSNKLIGALLYVLMCVQICVSIFGV